MDSLRAELAVLAARLIVEDGLDYGTAKRKAAKRLLGERVAHDLLPSNDEIEQQVREELALFHADTQPAQLLQLRRAIAFQVGEAPHYAGRGRVEQLTLHWPPHDRQAVLAHLSLYPEKDVRGALLPDAQGRTPRGTLRALRQLLSAPASEGENPRL
ncbi:MAG: hypothetical protein B7X43_04700 [Thiomonas sp. 15-63-373]|nr:MAG: hypothetical protein B7X43_04700 [Thiomonas sp. 15-63-373]